MIVAKKLAPQKCGIKKVMDRLHLEQPQVAWPDDSTAGTILKHAGLLGPREHRHRVVPYTEPFLDCAGPNQIWSADFKGDFAMGNGRRCYPFTLRDNFSRH